MNATTPQATTLAGIIAKAESRFASVLATIGEKSRFKDAVKAAETRYKTDLSAAALRDLIAARSELSAVGDIISDTDEQALPESERLAALNRRETFETIAVELDKRLGEHERLLVARRERLSDALRNFVMQGGEIDQRWSTWSKVDARPVEMALAAARSTNETINQITVALNVAKTSAEAGHLVNAGIGEPLGAKIDSLIALATRTTPQN